MAAAVPRRAARRPAGDRGPRSLRFAFVAALQLLPPRQRAILILREVLLAGGRGRRGAGHDDAAVNSALQRARAPLAESLIDPVAEPADAGGAPVDRYVEAFERADSGAAGC